MNSRYFHNLPHPFPSPGGRGVSTPFSLRERVGDEGMRAGKYTVRLDNNEFRTAFYSFRPVGCR